MISIATALRRAAPLLLLSSIPSGAAFSAQQQRPPTSPRTQPARRRQQHGTHRHPRQPSTSLSVLGTGAASILAGSVGGAIGVGVAYPLDTLKTKAQVYGQQQQQRRRLPPQPELAPPDDTPPSSAHPLAMENGTAAVALPHPAGTVCAREDCYPVESAEDDLIALVKVILEVEGVAGFFGGEG
ncbi:hypothetical protein ACHAWF_002446 [Thalassiosira exigua]